jgi:hypothetical protein
VCLAALPENRRHLSNGQKITNATPNTSLTACKQTAACDRRKSGTCGADHGAGTRRDGGTVNAHETPVSTPQPEFAMSAPHIYWHRDLPPANARPAGEHVLEAVSGRVAGTLAHRDDLWDHCYRELIARAIDRLGQEVTRLGGDCARVLAEHIEPRRDERTGEAWMYGRFVYELYRSPSAGGT